jgi:hypothetical protein
MSNHDSQQQLATGVNSDRDSDCFFFDSSHSTATLIATKKENVR